MVKIIENNLIINDLGEIYDHQSRIIEADSWEEYCEAFDRYDCNEVEFKSLTNLFGYSISREVKVNSLKYDDFHLSCNIYNSRIKTKHLAYLINKKI